MKRRLAWQLGMVFGVVSAVGCATTLWWGSPSNVKSTTLSLGMSTQQAQALLGSPRQISTQRMGDAIVETWTYLDRTLRFQNGVLQSWAADPSDQGH